MTAAETIAVVKSRGIKFSVPWAGDGSESNPYEPRVFGAWPDGYYHMDNEESDDPEAADARCVCWIDPDRSPWSAVDGIAAGNSPVFEVLADNR